MTGAAKATAPWSRVFLWVDIFAMSENCAADVKFGALLTTLSRTWWAPTADDALKDVGADC